MQLLYDVSEQEIKHALLRKRTSAIRLAISVDHCPEYDQPKSFVKRFLNRPPSKHPVEKSKIFKDYIEFESRMIKSLAGSESIFLYVVTYNPEQYSTMRLLLDKVSNDALPYKAFGNTKESLFMLMPQDEQTLASIRNNIWWEESFWGIIGGEWNLENPFMPETSIPQNWFIPHLDKLLFFFLFYNEAPGFELWTKYLQVKDIEDKIARIAHQLSIAIRTNNG